MPVIQFILILLLIWFLLEVIIRLVAENGIKTDFYGSVSRNEAQSLKEVFGLNFVQGDNSGFF